MTNNREDFLSRLGGSHGEIKLMKLSKGGRRTGGKQRQRSGTSCDRFRTQYFRSLKCECVSFWKRGADVAKTVAPNQHGNGYVIITRYEDGIALARFSSCRFGREDCRCILNLQSQPEPDSGSLSKSWGYRHCAACP